MRDIIYYVCFLIVLVATLVNLAHIISLVSGDLSYTYNYYIAKADLIGSPIPLLLRMLIPIPYFNQIIVLIAALLLIRRAVLIVTSENNKIPTAYSGFFYVILFAAFYGSLFFYLAVKASVFFGIHGIVELINYRDIYILFASIVVCPTIVLIELAS